MLLVYFTAYGWSNICMLHWMDMSKKVTRLYEQFQPEHYELTLDIDRDAMSFTGTVVMKGKKTGRPA